MLQQGLSRTTVPQVHARAVAHNRRRFTPKGVAASILLFTGETKGEGLCCDATLVSHLLALAARRKVAHYPELPCSG